MKRLYNPNNDILSKKRVEVNTVRDSIELFPIRYNGNLFDIDEKSDKRLAEAIDLAAELGVTEYQWTLADNTQKTFTIAELTTVYHELRKLRAIRSQSIHAEALNFKNTGFTPSDLSVWKESYKE